MLRDASESIVECRETIKEFTSAGNTARVLRGVDFSAPAGKLTMLVGPSGCGKTTLLSIIAGLLTPTSGRVELFGQDLAKLSDSARTQLRRKHIGFIFQQYNLVPSLSVIENAAVPLVAAGHSDAAAQNVARPILDALGMSTHAKRLPALLSGGQQQRVAIARALVHKPRLIVCDEPTAALDADSGQTVMRLLRDIALRPDCAVVVVTHDSRIYHFADRIAHMEDGLIQNVEEQTRAA